MNEHHQTGLARQATLNAATAAQWQTELSQAISLDDDSSVWRLLDQHHDPVEAHHSLATQVARLAYRIADRTRFSELFLVPVIVDFRANLTPLS